MSILMCAQEPVHRESGFEVPCHRALVTLKLLYILFATGGATAKRFELGRGMASEHPVRRTLGVQM